jgi:hypothetical protein
MATCLPPLQDYAGSRARFLADAEARGAAFDHHPHPLPGPDGPVFTDVARLGPPPGEAERVVVVASGTHGVEGHLGWGLQVLLLDDARLRRLDEGVAVVLVHAVNPYGMAWSRRVDHENIDVNRNFVDFDGELPANPHYAEVDAVLNPEALDLDDTAWQAELLAFGERVGAHVAFRVLSGGQYDHPRGVQFGGQAPSWSRRTMTEVWTRHLRGARVVVNLDVHSGLGPCGGLTLFQTADRDEVAAEAARAWFPAVLRADRSAGADALNTGLLNPGLEETLAPGVVAAPLTVEFGTREVPEVFGAMRADNWLHQHGDPRSPVGERIRAATREAFFVDDEGWRTTVATQGMATVHAALDAVGPSVAV